MELKKVIRSLTLVMLVMFILGSTSIASAATKFTDVKNNNIHAEGIYWLADKGITGYPDGTYGINESLSREHAARMFVEVFDLKLPKASKVEEYFDDVSAGYVYAKEIAAVAKAGIITGNDGEFFPTDDLSREQMASTLVRAYDFEKSQEKKSIKLSNVTKDHRESVQILADLEITSELKNFRPIEKVTRSQFATFLYRSEKVGIGEIEPSGPKNYYISKSYNYNFATMLNKQMALTPLPQTDSAGTWYDASQSFAQYYLNPKNFAKESQEYFQFLKLSGSSEVSTNQLNNNVLAGKGVLSGKATNFKKASKTHDVNEIYLISHALLETGNGTSTLAKGVKVGTNKSGKPVRVTTKNRKNLNNIKVAYNYFGIGAFDSCALSCGSERAYSEGWFTAKKAIVGGAQFISRDYVSKGQDTLYKMRWNPDKPATHQYASDAGWAVKQTGRIKEIYDLLQNDNKVMMNFEIPNFNKQPAAKAKPTGGGVFNINKNHVNAGKTGKVTANSLNFRTGPTTKFKTIKALSKGTKVKVIGENTGWYKLKVGSQQGWASASYINVNGAKTIAEPKITTYSDQLVVTPEDEQLVARESNPDRIIGEVTTENGIIKKKAKEDSDSIVERLTKGTKVEIVNEKDGWFKVLKDGTEGWMTYDSISITNVKSVKANTVVKDEPNGKTIDNLYENDTVIVILNENLELTKDGEWYEVNYHGQKVWIHQSQFN